MDIFFKNVNAQVSNLGIKLFIISMCNIHFIYSFSIKQLIKVNKRA